MKLEMKLKNADKNKDKVEYEMKVAGQVLQNNTDGNTNMNININTKRNIHGRVEVMGGRGEERTGEVIDATTYDVMAENNTTCNLHLLLLIREVNFMKY